MPDLRSNNELLITPTNIMWSRARPGHNRTTRITTPMTSNGRLNEMRLARGSAPPSGPDALRGSAPIRSVLTREVTPVRQRIP